MKSRIFALMAVLSLLCIPCQAKKNTVKGNGEITTKTIELSDFNEISFRNICTFSFSNIFSMKKNSYTSPTFIYRQTSDASLKITTDKNIMPLLDIKVRNGVLSINIKNDENITPSKMIFEGNSASLSAVRIGGGNNFIIDSDFKGESLNVEVAGGGDFDAEKRISIKNGDFSISGGGDLDVENLECGDLNVRVSGGGDADIQGKAVNATFRVSGGGDLNAYKLITENAVAKVSGGGDMKIYAEKTLEASASGGGDIYYKGNPEANTSTSGGGDVHKVK